MRTVLRCIVITDEHDTASIQSWGFISRHAGVRRVPRSCVNTLCVARVTR